MTSRPRARWPWARWSLARQLPLLTAAIVIIVMTLLLSLTYRALVATRSDALHERLDALKRVLVQSGATSSKTRVGLVTRLATDSALVRALTAPTSFGTPPDANVVAALEKFSVATDSGLPVELWNTEGVRIANIGGDVRGDSVAALPPEMRSLSGRQVSQVPRGASGSHSVQLGALYAASGRVYYWSIAPVLRDSQRLGFVVQQRRIVPNAAVAQTVKDLSGEDVTVYLRNATDGFWSSLDGRPASAPLARDTTTNGFIATRAGGVRTLGTEGLVPGTPYLFTFEAPESDIVAQPRATIRRIALLSIFVLVGAVLVTWLISRRITRPLVELTTAAEGIAQGEYARRVELKKTSSDEVERLSASFNRMAAEVEASQRELASQVEEALATSEELEHTNIQLQDASTAAAEARDAALHANRAKSDFLAVMSHELRTPLNAIGGYTEILQLGIYGEMNAAQQDALQRIVRSQQTLLALINDVLNFAKIEAGAVRYSIEDVPLAPVLTAIEEFVAPQLLAKRITYSVRPCDDDVFVRADSDKLQQILINLLSNAVKFTAEGGSIDVACDTDAHTVNVHVHDTGLGIAADRIEKIFDPFIQVGRALNRPHDGVGLGLSISRDLATAMGGSLHVRSTVGEGSTFTLRLQRAGVRTPA